MTPTRHWSVARDIKRKHAGIGQPISQDLENKKEQACKELTDLVTLMTVYLNIEELNSAPLQPTLPFYRPQPWFKPFNKLHNETIMNARKRIEEQKEREEQQQPHSWVKKEDCMNLGVIKELKDNHWACRAIKEEKRGTKKI